MSSLKTTPSASVWAYRARWVTRTSRTNAGRWTVRRPASVLGAVRSSRPIPELDGLVLDHHRPKRGDRHMVAAVLAATTTKPPNDPAPGRGWHHRTPSALRQTRGRREIGSPGVQGGPVRGCGRDRRP